MRHRRTFVAAAVLAQLLLLLLVVAPRLSPRLGGDELRILVAPVDPIDPFRGAYVDLSYARQDGQPGFERLEGDVYLPLVRDRRLDAYRLGVAQRGRPPGGRFLACRADGELACGIESFFASQREAKRLERDLGRRRDSTVARVRVDGAGRAAIVGLEPARARR